MPTLASDFMITLGLHQEFALRPFLFITVVNELIRVIHNEISWCILLPDNIVLINEIRAS